MNRNLLTFFAGILIWGAALSPFSVGAEDAKPVIYQMLTRLFGNKVEANRLYGPKEVNGVGKFNDITDKALSELKALGATYIWYTGVIRHATMTDYSAFGVPKDNPYVVKGRAGSPYAITDYYDVDPDLAVDVKSRMKEFRDLVERTHRAGLKVLVDFVPNHVARGYHSITKPAGVRDLGQGDDTSSFFSPKNNFYYLPGTTFQVPPEYAPLGPGNALFPPGGRFPESPAKATGNDRFTPTPSKDDWFETVKLNYGYNPDDEALEIDPRPDTWAQMRDILLFWAAQKVDGFRCDIAEMVPVEFWAWAIPQVKKAYPGTLFIAEIYRRTWYEDFIKKGRFDYLYDKVGLYDSLRPLTRGEGSPADITKKLDYLPVDQKFMVRFLENHDEQRIASPAFAGDPNRAKGAMIVTAALAPGAVMIYFGQEVGEKGAGAEGFQGDDGRTTIFDYWGVPAHQRWMNGGAFDGAKLLPQERALRSWYQRLLNTVRAQPALSGGECYNLDKEARGQPGYPDSVFVWARRAPGQRVFGLVNFDFRNKAALRLKLSPAALKALGVPAEGATDLRDLLGGSGSFTLRNGILEGTLDPGQGGLWEEVHK